MQDAKEHQQNTNYTVQASVFSLALLLAARSRRFGSVVQDDVARDQCNDYNADVALAAVTRVPVSTIVDIVAANGGVVGSSDGSGIVGGSGGDRELLGQAVLSSLPRLRLLAAVAGVVPLLLTLLLLPPTHPLLLLLLPLDWLSRCDHTTVALGLRPHPTAEPRRKYILFWGSCNILGTQEPKSKKVCYSMLLSSLVLPGKKPRGF